MMAHSSFAVKRSLILGMDLAYASHSVDAFAEKFYAKMLDWTWPFPPERGEWNKDRYFSGSSLEIVPIVAALLHLCQGDVNRCIVEGASFGRDCDTISSVVGSIAAAMQGASAICPDWIETVETGNREFFQEVEGDPNANFHAMAQRMVEVLHKERQDAEDRAGQLAQIIGA